jgi:hypothetical protein
VKIRFAKKRDTRGSVLVIALAITFVLGLGLASYLLLMSWQNASVARSQAWNGSLALAEAGVEEALAQLNPSSLLFDTNIDRGANSWSLLSDGFYHAPRGTLTDGYYDVAVTADTLPTIYATGYVTIPSLSVTVSRTLRLTTGYGPLFRGSMAARVNVDLKGNNIATDSFDSADPNYSTNGLYDPTKRKAGGDIATTQGIINVQNANVMGTLYTGPGGSYTVGPSGSVGDVAWVTGGNNGLESGHYKNDFNMDFPIVLAPYQSGVPPQGGTISGTNYAWILGSGNYMDSDVGGASFKSGDIILVTGAAKVYVTGNFQMSSSATLIIAPGASLQLYVGGANTTISTVNNAGNCSSFSYFGLPANTSITLGGNDSFMGTIYAPQADLTLSGGGNNTLDYQGAISVNTIGMNGHFNFHFDENLKRAGPIRGFQITSWGEI